MQLFMTQYGPNQLQAHGGAILAQEKAMNGNTASNEDAPRLKRKRSKVRSAWISFVGRIVAQIIGAIASVTLGLMVLHRYGFPERASNASNPAVTSPAAPAAHDADRKARRAAGELALAVLPIQNYSQDAAHMYFADGVTEALTAELAQITGLRVTSRTSSMGYKGTTKSLPAIARELDVDLILEGSVVREQGLVRATDAVDRGGHRSPRLGPQLRPADPEFAARPGGNGHGVSRKTSPRPSPAGGSYLCRNIVARRPPASVIMEDTPSRFYHNDQPPDRGPGRRTRIVCAAVELRQQQSAVTDDAVAVSRGRQARRRRPP